MFAVDVSERNVEVFGAQYRVQFIVIDVLEYNLRSPCLQIHHRSIRTVCFHFVGRVTLLFSSFMDCVILKLTLKIHRLYSGFFPCSFGPVLCIPAAPICFSHSVVSGREMSEKVE